jgi:hypothetical protein
MTQLISSSLTIVLTTFLLTTLTTQATAGSPWRPHIGLPKINLGRTLKAAAYPVTKSLINGGKTVLKTAATGETLGLLPSIGPPAVNTMVKKIIITFGRH